MGGSLTKLRINTYKDDTYKDSSKINENAYEAFINPTGFSMTYKTKVQTAQAQGKPDASLGYIASPPSDLLLEFLFDGTGVTEANSGNKLLNTLSKKDFTKTTVDKQINAFYTATGKLDGNIHKPYNVIINWGKLEFKGILAEFTLEYKLFSNDGNPLRAIGKAKFSESISPELSEKQADRKSPDLTHKRTVKAGDTLPLMAQGIYGDPKYYLEIAKLNGLLNFRQLTPGQELFFPPIAKTS